MISARPRATLTGSHRITIARRLGRAARHAGDLGKPARLLLLCTLTVLLTSCTTRQSVFRIVDHRDPGSQVRYHETFDEAFFDMDEHGNVDVVLRRSSPDENHPAQLITQIIHIRSLWRSIPGTTVAHRTQLNSTIRYQVLAGRLGATFEGTGSVFFKLNRRREMLTGSLDLALLQPKRILSAGGDLFKKAELTGEFRAIRDPRTVVRIVNEMDRVVGDDRVTGATPGPLGYVQDTRERGRTHVAVRRPPHLPR